VGPRQPNLPDEYRRLSKRLSKREQELSEERDRSVKQLEQIGRLTTRARDLEALYSNSRDNRRGLESSRKRYEEEIRAFKAKADEKIRSLKEKADVEEKKAGQRISELEKEVQNMKDENVAVKLALSERNKAVISMEGHKGELLKARHDVTRNNQLISTYQNQVNTIHQKLQTTERELRTTKTDFDALKQQQEWEKKRFAKLKMWGNACQSGLTNIHGKAKSLESENALLKSNLRLAKEENERLQATVEKLTIELCTAKDSPVDSKLNTAQRAELARISEYWGPVSPKKSTSDDQKESLGDVMMPLLRSFVPDCIFRPDPSDPALDLADLKADSSPIPPLNKILIPEICIDEEASGNLGPELVDSKETASPDSASLCGEEESQIGEESSPATGSHHQICGFGWDSLEIRTGDPSLFPELPPVQRRPLVIEEDFAGGDRVEKTDVTGLSQTDKELLGAKDYTSRASSPSPKLAPVGSQTQTEDRTTPEPRGPRVLSLPEKTRQTSS